MKRLIHRSISTRGSLHPLDAPETDYDACATGTQSLFASYSNRGLIFLPFLDDQISPYRVGRRTQARQTASSRPNAESSEVRIVPTLYAQRERERRSASNLRR